MSRSHLSEVVAGGNTIRAFLLVLVSLFASFASFAASESRQFDNDEQRALYLKLINEFRCLKCQNQNLAGSSAALAGDLKDEIHSMVLDNKSGADISDYLVARYGDFVRYRPPFKLTTIVLWLAPFLMMIVGVWSLTRFAGGRTAVPDTASDEELARARSLLED